MKSRACKWLMVNVVKPSQGKSNQSDGLIVVDVRDTATGCGEFGSLSAFVGFCRLSAGMRAGKSQRDFRYRGEHGQVRKALLVKSIHGFGSRAT
jgi:hypothetical protein